MRILAKINLKCTTFCCDGARHNIGTTSVQKVCDDHYSACKLPDQKKTATQTDSVAQPVTWVARRCVWGGGVTTPNKYHMPDYKPRHLAYQWRH